MKGKQRKYGIKGKKLTAVLLTAVMLLLSACANQEKQEYVEYISKKYAVPYEKQLIVYTSHKEEVYLPIIREFENRTGIWVEVHAGGTAQMLEQARQASAEGACDIMFGGGIESYEAQKDLFMQYETEDRATLDPNYLSADNYWTPFTELPIVFIYNKKLVSAAEAPAKWEDLFDPKWKGNIAFADPRSSGTSYTIISTMEQIFNKDAKEILPDFYDNLDGKVLSSSGDVIPEVSNGTCLVGITLEETAKKYINLGYDIAMRYPVDGTSAVPDGCAIVKNAPHTYNAGKFIDFVVGYDTQKYATENFERRSVRLDVDTEGYYPEINQISFDIERSAKEEETVYAIWDELISSEGE
ncbi:MAG: extracellular solute-binding protein [Butyrivibrio sp.]|nr:extracellular solute-binding protein [Butyrivibrio sp.]